MDSSVCFPGELTAPNELRGQSPRVVFLSGSGVQLALAVAILLGLAAASAVWVGKTVSIHKQESAALRSRGEDILGQVKEVRSSGPVEPTVAYSFTADGTEYSSEVRVPKDLARSVARSGPLLIRYLPENPAISHPAGWEYSSLSETALFIAPAIAAVLGLILLLPLGLERRMAAEGVPALAMVKKCTHTRTGYVVHYEFRLGDGPKVKGRGWFQDPQEAGEGVWILYLPKNPRRNVPYPLSYFRVAELNFGKS
jgi:hypothetical protein